MRRSIVVVTAVVLTLGAPALAPQGLAAPAVLAVSAKDRPPPSPKLTPWQKALGKVSKKTGRLSKHAALVLFEMTFGDVPGVKAPRNRGPVLSGTPAVRAVMAHFAEYSPKQQQAIRRLLEPPPGSVTITPPPPDQVPSTSQPNMVPIAYIRRPIPPKLIEETRKTVATYRQRYAQRLGFDMPDPAIIFAPAGTKNPQLPGAAAWTGPRAGSTICDMTFPVNELEDRSFRALIIAHELFHCFQYAIAPNKYGPAPDWLIDGSAEYAASEVQSVNTSNFWSVYTTTPTKDLFERTYDALGFYAHLAEAGIDPYRVIPDMLRDGTNEGAYQASGAMTDQFVDSWASGYFRGDVKGQAWNMTGPGIAKYRAWKAQPTSIAIRADDPEGQPFNVKAHTNSIYRLQIAADALEIEVDAGSHARISDSTNDRVVQGIAQFCTRAAGCACPSGGGGAAPRAPLKRTPALAISGGTAGSTATVTGLSLKDLCCAGGGRAATVQGLTVTPRVDCQQIGLTIEKADRPLLRISYALLVDHPRLDPHFETRKGKKTLTGVDLEGIKGIVLDFGAGAVRGVADNGNFVADVPVEVEVPVRPRTPRLPRSVTVHWTFVVKTAITGNNSTLIGREQFSFAGPLGLRNGTIAAPAPRDEQDIFDTLGGITLGPSGIVITVHTRFSAGAGTPTGAKGIRAALTASFGITNGPVFGAPLVTCQRAEESFIFAAGGGGLSTEIKTLLERDRVKPYVAACV